MTTKELITNIASDTKMTKKRVESLLSAMTRVILDGSTEGKSVQLKNFGTLEVKTKKPRKIVHPKTKEVSMTEEKRVLSFRPNTNIKDEVKNL